MHCEKNTPLHDCPRPTQNRRWRADEHAEPAASVPTPHSRRSRSPRFVLAGRLRQTFDGWRVGRSAPRNSRERSLAWQWRRCGGRRVWSQGRGVGELRPAAFRPGSAARSKPSARAGPCRETLPQAGLCPGRGLTVITKFKPYMPQAMRRPPCEVSAIALRSHRGRANESRASARTRCGRETSAPLTVRSARSPIPTKRGACLC
jgi:hypothetical protein